MERPNFYCSKDIRQGHTECQHQCEGCKVIEREEILLRSGTYTPTPMMVEEKRTFSKEQMLLFGGFCAAKMKMNPGMRGSEIWDEWEKIIT